MGDDVLLSHGFKRWCGPRVTAMSLVSSRTSLFAAALPSHAPEGACCSFCQVRPGRLGNQLICKKFAQQTQKLGPQRLQTIITGARDHFHSPACLCPPGSYELSCVHCLLLIYLPCGLRAKRCVHLAQVHDSAIAELARKIAKLVSTVAVRGRLHAGQQGISSHHFHKLRSLCLLAHTCMQQIFPTSH